MDPTLHYGTEVCFYSVEGEQIARMYTEDEFLRCPDTRDTLEHEWEERVATSLRPRLESLAEQVVAVEHDRESSVLGKTTPGAFAGRFAAIVEHHLAVRYRFALFAETPDLARPLKAFLAAERA